MKTENQISAIHSSSTIQISTECGKRFNNQKVQRLMKSLEKSKEVEPPATRSSQPKKKFASLLWAICREDDFEYNLHAAGSLQAPQTDINTVHIHELTIKWEEMAPKVGNSSLLNLLALVDLALNEVYYHHHCYDNMV